MLNLSIYLDQWSSKLPCRILNGKGVDRSIDHFHSMGLCISTIRYL